jgi:hypothetical protein
MAPAPFSLLSSEYMSSQLSTGTRGSSVFLPPIPLMAQAPQQGVLSAGWGAETATVPRACPYSPHTHTFQATYLHFTLVC